MVQFLTDKVENIVKYFPTMFSKGFYPRVINPLPDSSELKDFADNNFKFDENGRKLSKPVENTVGKGEISPFPIVFSKGLFPRGVKRRHCVGMG